MDPTWAFTVLSATNSSLLISRFVLPNMSDARTCISRAVRVGVTGERVSFGGSIVHGYPKASQGNRYSPVCPAASLQHSQRKLSLSKLGQRDCRM